MQYSIQYNNYSPCNRSRNRKFQIFTAPTKSINQSSLRLFEKKTLLTQTQKGCTIELKNRKTKYVCSEKKEYGQYDGKLGTNIWRGGAPHIMLLIQSSCCSCVEERNCGPLHGWNGLRQAYL